MSEITFAVHAPDAETFWNSWITAGICTAPHEYTENYRDHIEVRDWGSGQIDGKAGWFANVRVTGGLVAEFTYQLPQVGEDGSPLSIWDRTWATHVFQLTYRDRDEATGFPAGYASSQGVAYTDMADIATPYEVRQ